MKILLAVLTISLLAAKHVHSLDCYATDFLALKAKNFDAVPIVQNCDDFLKEIAYYRNEIFNPGLLNDDDLGCFTVRIDSDKANMAIQGCSLRDSCEALVDSVRMDKWSPIEKGLYINNVTCSECEEALCNAGITRSIAMKNSFSFERRKYLVITVVIIIAFMVVVSIMLRVFSRKSQSVVVADKKYSLLTV